MVPPASTGLLKWANLATLQAMWTNLEKWQASSSLQLSQVEVEARRCGAMAAQGPGGLLYFLSSATWHGPAFMGSLT